MIGEVHQPVKLMEISSSLVAHHPEHGLYTGVAIFGVVGSGKTSACMHPFARQLLRSSFPSFRSPEMLIYKLDSFEGVRSGVASRNVQSHTVALARGGEHTGFTSPWRPRQVTEVTSASFALPVFFPPLRSILPEIRP